MWRRGSKTAASSPLTSLALIYSLFKSFLMTVFTLCCNAGNLILHLQQEKHSLNDAAGRKRKQEASVLPLTVAIALVRHAVLFHLLLKCYSVLQNKHNDSVTAVHVDKTLFHKLFCCCSTFLAFGVLHQSPQPCITAQELFTQN